MGDNLNRNKNNRPSQAMDKLQCTGWADVNMTDEISTLLDLMSKSKINFLIPLIVRGEQVILPLLFSPATPNLFPPPILPDIIPLG
jgi:hypothetical protein